MTNRLARNANHSPIYGSSKVGLNGLTVHMQVGENSRMAAEEKRGGGGQGMERVRFYTVAVCTFRVPLFVPRARLHCKTFLVVFVDQ